LLLCYRSVVVKFFRAIVGLKYEVDYLKIRWLLNYYYRFDWMDFVVEQLLQLGIIVHVDRYDDKMNNQVEVI
jgi:hypothetical protein